MALSKQSSQQRVRPTLAATLIEKILSSGAMDIDRLARQLITTPSMIARFRDRRESISPDRQMLLALVILDHVPMLARYGRQLRDQVRAAARFAEGEVVTHDQPPAPFGR